MQSNIPAQTGLSRCTKRVLRHSQSLRFQMVLWYLLIMAVILFFFSTAIYLIESHTLYQNLDATLDATITQLAPSYDPQQGLLVDNNTTRRLFNTLVIVQDPQTRTTRIINGLTALQPPSQAEPPIDLSGISAQANSPLSFSYQYPTGQTLRFTTAGGPTIYQILVGYRPYAVKRVIILDTSDKQSRHLYAMYVGIFSDIPNQLGQLRTLLAVVTPLILFFSSLGGYWLASKAIRPMLEITRTAQEISEIDLHRRLPLRRQNELGELATTLNGMLDRLESAFERQRQFTADASHELRTPLSIVNTEVERVLQRPHTSQEHLQTLEIVQQENQRMIRLVSDLLTLARADKGQAVLKYEQVDLSEIVVDAAERLAPLTRQNGIAVHFSDLDETLLWGDRLYLTQLCTNLLENAIKYSAGIGKHVEIRLDREPSHVQLQIIDEGPGIDPSDLPHLFERFYRVDPSRTHNQPGGSIRSTSGSGLGLSIARWIVYEHGGTIQVQSSLGKGSVFEVCLPFNRLA